MAFALRRPPLSCRTSPPRGGRSDGRYWFRQPARWEIGESKHEGQSPPLRGRCPAGQRGARRSTILAAFLLLLTLFSGAISPATADESSLRATIAKFATAKGFPAIEAVVRELGASGDPAVAKALTALSDGDLSLRKSDSQIFIVKEGGAAVTLHDPLTGEPAGQADRSDLTKIKVNNGLRSVIRDVLGSLTLSAPDPAVRL